MSKPTIGWQKYEDLLESQMNSPILETLLEKYQTVDNYEEDYEEPVDEKDKSEMLIPLSPKMLDDIAMLNNFECWMGHTNFDITPATKEALNNVKGVELLKICSRYRFFIGVGRMFKFADVRREIEDQILEGD